MNVAVAPSTPDFRARPYWQIRRPCCSRWYPREPDSGGRGAPPAPFGSPAQISPPSRRFTPPPPPRGGATGPSSTTAPPPAPPPFPPPRETFFPPRRSKIFPKP